MYCQYYKCLFTQSCPTLCTPMDCSPPGSSVLGILQTRILEWVAILFSRGSSQELNLGLLHCRWTFYCLSYQSSIIGPGNSMVNRNKVVIFRKPITLPYLVHIATISLQSKCRLSVFPGMLEMQNLRCHSKFLDSESVYQQDPQRVHVGIRF